MAEQPPRFRGIDRDEWHAEGVSRVLGTYGQEVVRYVESVRRGLEGQVSGLGAQQLADRALLLAHASRHRKPGASGEDPLDISELTDHRSINRPKPPLPHALTHQFAGIDRGRGLPLILVADMTAGSF